MLLNGKLNLVNTWPCFKEDLNAAFRTCRNCDPWWKLLNANILQSNLQQTEVE